MRKLPQFRLENECVAHPGRLGGERLINAKHFVLYTLNTKNKYSLKSCQCEVLEGKCPDVAIESMKSEEEKKR